MTALPSGTVTLLFSDIEGSTRMVHALGEGWTELLVRQRELCRTSWAAYDGHELATEGDSFFVAFADAAAAVAAAVDAQRRLSAGDWSQETPVRVRIGMHTGSPVQVEAGYAGMDVHRGARVSSAAHGGQVLVSAATVEAAGLRSVADLGWHHLKDLPDRMHLYQVVADGLEQEFPPIRSRGSLGGLPGVDGPIIGRASEVEALSALLEDGARLVTLTGTGGSGKTRLATAVATEAAPRYADGVHFVPLVGATDADEAWSEIGRALGHPTDPRQHVSGLDALVILDNLEQCNGIDGLVRELLARAPDVVLVATSRRALHVEGEQELAVQPLDVVAGTELFLARSAPARALTSGGDVDELVRRLDGLPLAIEIAAARTRLLSPAALLARIDGVLDVAGHGVGARQRTIRGTIGWSYDLLADESQRVLDCLGVFVDGAPLPAIGLVTAPEGVVDLLDVLFALVDLNLVQVTDTDDGEPRFSVLETVRTFALDRLDARGVRADREARHASYYYDVVARHWNDRHTLHHARNQAEYLREASNLRAVVGRGAHGVRDPRFYGDDVPPGHVVALFVVVAGALFRRFAEARAWIQVGLDLPSLDPCARAALLHDLGFLEARVGDSRTALGILEEAIGIASALDDVDERVLPEWVDPTWRLFLCHREAAHAHLNLHDHEAARRACDRMRDVRPPPGPERLVVHELPYLIAVNAGDLDLARTHLELEGRMIEQMGLVRERLMWANNAADLDIEMGQHAVARRRLAEHCEAVIAQGDLDLTGYVLSTFAAATGPVDPVLASRAYGAALGIRADEDIPVAERDRQAVEQQMVPTRDALGPERWRAEVEAGRHLDVAEMLRTLVVVAGS